MVTLGFAWQTIRRSRYRAGGLSSRPSPRCRACNVGWNPTTLLSVRANARWPSGTVPPGTCNADATRGGPRAGPIPRPAPQPPAGCRRVTHTGASAMSGLSRATIARTTPLSRRIAVPPLLRGATRRNGRRESSRNALPARSTPAVAVTPLTGSAGTAIGPCAPRMGLVVRRRLAPRKQARFGPGAANAPSRPTSRGVNQCRPSTPFLAPWHG